MTAPDVRELPAVHLLPSPDATEAYCGEQFTGQRSSGFLPGAEDVCPICRKQGLGLDGPLPPTYERETRRRAVLALRGTAERTERPCPRPPSAHSRDAATQQSR
jgi:hypothetical protein